MIHTGTIGATEFDPSKQYGVFWHYAPDSAEEPNEAPGDLVSLLENQMQSFVPKEHWNRIVAIHTPPNKELFAADRDNPLGWGSYALKYNPPQ